MSVPFTPGSEAAGVVREVGDGITELQAGDRVVSPNVRGAYAQCAIVPVDRAVRVPDDVDLETAAAVCLQGMTAHYLATSTYALQPGDSCLVHAAAGGVGLLLGQIASRRGAHVIGTASSPEKLQLAADAGAKFLVNYKAQDFAAEAKRITGGAGVNVVYDSVGRDTFDRSLDSLAPRGMLVLFGQSSGPVPPFDPQLLNQKGSLFLTRPTLAHYVATRTELLQRAKDLFAWIENDRLHVRIGARFSLEEAAAAHQALSSRETTGKVLLLPPRSRTP